MCDYYSPQTTKMSLIIQHIVGFTSLDNYFQQTISRLRIHKSEDYLPDDISSVTVASPLSTSTNDALNEGFLDDDSLIEESLIEESLIEESLIEEPIEPVRVHVTLKPKKQDWNKWAKMNNLKDYQTFRVRYIGNTCKITGFWHDGRYVLTSDRVAPIPPGREAEATKKGWGVPIECDCPTHLVSLVKMSYGAAINNGRSVSARPYELEMQLPYNRWIPVYKS
jgi:hypothetical protein